MLASIVDVGKLILVVRNINFLFTKFRSKVLFKITSRLFFLCWTFVV